jgi:hypothetical protein
MALVTRYINTASSTGGDGTTNGTAGATRAYVSMLEWEAAENVDLVTATDTHIVYCSGTAADTTSCDNTGWTTDATYFVTISGHLSSGTGYNDTGIYSTSYYRLDPASSHAFKVKNTANSWVVEKIQLRIANSGSRIFESQAGTDAWTVRKCNIRGEGEKTIKTRIDWIVENNVIDGRGVGEYGISCEGTTNLVYNNVVTGFVTAGVFANSNTATIKNNAVFDNADDFLDVASATLDYNASDDGDGTNSVDISPGGTEATDWAAAFTDYAAFDFTPLDDSSVLFEAGVGSGTDGNVPLDDYLEVTRNTTSPSIGAFELLGVVYFIPTLLII